MLSCGLLTWDGRSSDFYVQRLTCVQDQGSPLSNTLTDETYDRTRSVLSGTELRPSLTAYVTAYPNPVTDVLRIETTAAVTVTSVA